MTELTAEQHLAQLEKRFELLEGRPLTAHDMKEIARAFEVRDAARAMAGAFAMQAARYR